MKIRIKNLRLRTIIGINEWERKNLQDVIINIEIDFDGRKASETDDIEHTVNYKTITKEVIEFVENHHFYLVEKLVYELGQLVLKSPGVKRVRVEVDKPHALRFADSVSVSEEWVSSSQ